MGIVNTAKRTKVAGSTSVVILAKENKARKQLVIVNDSTAILSIAYVQYSDLTAQVQPFVEGTSNVTYPLTVVAGTNDTWQFDGKIYTVPAGVYASGATLVPAINGGIVNQIIYAQANGSKIRFTSKDYDQIGKAFTAGPTDFLAGLNIAASTVMSTTLPSSATDFSIKLPGNANGDASVIESEFTGLVVGFWASATGNAFVTES
jgi:hypothetical protein